jgi:hypothetical protein
MKLKGQLASTEWSSQKIKNTKKNIKKSKNGIYIKNKKETIKNIYKKNLIGLYDFLMGKNDNKKKSSSIENK